MFIVAKIVQLFLEPANIAILLIAGGAALCWTKWERLGHAILSVMAGICLVILLFPIDQWMARPLESKFPPPKAPAHVDGILVLSGTLLNVVEGVAIARRYPNAKVVYTGGSTYLFGDDEGPSYVGQLLVNLGISRDRLVLESKARTTYENFVFSQRLLAPTKGQVWLLVTSAMHMTRAKAVADHLHWQVVPWPSEYISDPSGGSYWMLSFVKTAYGLSRVLHEYESLIAYRLEGKTDYMFP